MTIFTGFMTTQTKASFTEGVIIGYGSGIVSDYIKENIPEPKIDFCSAGELQRFPPPQEQCSGEEYSIILVKKPSILYNIVAFCISGFCVISCAKTCATGTPDERATLMGAFVGISLQDWVSDAD